MVKKLGTLVSKESEIIHSPFHGERVMGREAINAKIRINNSAWQDVKLHSYSPFGIEFVNDNINLKQGENLSVRINLAGDETLFNGLVVNSIHNDVDGRSIVGVRTFIREKKGDIYSGAERRIHRRWSCSDDFLPTGMAPNPVRYNDYILFRIEDISSGGLKLITSMRNKFLGIGQKLECKLSIPYVGSVGANIEVKYINTTFYKEREFMIIGAEFTNTDPILLRSLGEYLLNFAKEVTVKSLNSEGFGIKNVSKWLDFSYVKTEEEYRQVLELRYKAFKSAGMLNDSTKVDDMSDTFDSKASILIAKYNGKIVGSVRISSYDNQNEEMQYKDYIHLINKGLTPTNFIELSRLCSDPEFRGGDVIDEMHSHELMAAIKENKAFFIASAKESLLEHYKNLGWKTTGIFPEMEKLFPLASGIKHEIIIFDVIGVLMGKNVKVKTWNKLYKNISSHLIRTGLITPSFSDLIKLTYYKILGTFLIK